MLFVCLFSVKTKDNDQSIEKRGAMQKKKGTR